MKFGHFCLPTYFPDVDGDQGLLMRRWIDLLADSEALGFDSLWANEHHFDSYGGLIPSPATFLAALSQRTSHARLGTSIIVLPLNNPIAIAEQLAMVDLMSGGRLEFGIGRGFVDFDYDRLGVPRDDSQERMYEQLDIILKAWSGEPFAHEGKYYNYPKLELWPQPEQRPHPPIWLSCSRTPASYEWAGQRGYKILTIPYLSVEMAAENNKIYRAAWAEAGHAANEWQIAAHYHCVLCETKQEARQIGRDAWRRYLAATNHTRDRNRMDGDHVVAPSQRQVGESDLDMDKMVEELRTIACTPGEAVALLEKAQDAMGFTQCDCTFYFGGVSHDQARRSMHLFTSEVMPKLKDREPAIKLAATGSG
jgi:alkanesulfonate monooxygenase SsuD/methylene tetrahydromethanopterin reductase-like flavin-dependent oxidoreductase (luciferase family)